MRNSATLFLTLATCAAALVTVPMVTLAKAATNDSDKEKAKKIQASPSFSDPRSTDRANATCFRAIDCATWPPRINDDPDRKAGGAGGM
ncbi:hypothetical protein SAMN05444170_0737 [Bradyrhizobium erythrophlei]|uniref:Uncharacterized protein n=1 Tax=Bradyrhizobium erythrophlei TaxID=1437360 RepID=A0A1M7T4D1_9BRAD|nr:hypothetical protein SAMN05444170_0737 [Bradyrhizobium erythrophlei]